MLKDEKTNNIRELKFYLTEKNQVSIESQCLIRSKFLGTTPIVL